MQNLLEIKRVLTVHKARLFKKYGVRELAVFGSFARSQQSNQSDIDILVDFERSIGIEFIDLAEELEDLLQCKVDLISKKGVKQKYLQAISGELNYV